MNWGSLERHALFGPDPDQLEAPARSRWSRLRLTLLILVLFFEIAFVIILRTVGWNGTTIVLAAIAWALPIIVGLVFIFHRGRNFSIRSLLIATACFACFIVVSLQPLLNAQRARRVTIAIQEAGGHIHPLHELISICRAYDRACEDLVEFDNREPIPEFPAWIRPLAGNLPATPRNDALVYLSVESDAQLKLVCDSADELPNLRMLSVQGVSKNGTRFLGDHAGDFKQLDSILIFNSPIGDDCFNKLTACRQLMYIVRGNTGFLPSPTHEQLAQVAGLTNLEHLMISCSIDDSDLKQLSGSRSLKDLRIYSANITPAAAESFKKLHPNCNVIIN